MSRLPVPSLPFGLPKLTPAEWKELKSDPVVMLRRSWRNSRGMRLWFRFAYHGSSDRRFLTAFISYQGVTMKYRVPGAKPQTDDDFGWGDE